MAKIFRICLIPLVIVLSFCSLSFGEQLERATWPTNSSNRLIYGPCIVHQKGEIPFSSPEKTEFGGAPYIARPSKAVSNQGISKIQEISNTIESFATTIIPQKDLSDFKNHELSMINSSCHFGKINFIKTNLEPSLNFISSLSLAHYKGENPLSWTLEKFKENDIFKPFAIFLELELNF